MERVFSGWADFVSRRTIWVFIASLIFFIGWSFGMTMSKEYEDEDTLWTPAGNPTLKAQDKAKILFPVEENFWYMSLIV